MKTSEEIAFLSRLYQDAPIGLCLLDRELRFLQINKWLANLNGLPVNAHLGERIADILPDVARGIEKQLRAVIETGKPVIKGSVEAETAADPGEKRSYEHSYSAFRSNDDTIVGVSCVVEDITARKREASSRRRAEESLKQANELLEQRVAERTADITLANQALRDSETRVRVILDNALDAVIRIDCEGRIISWNPQAEKLSGWSQSEAVGRSLAETIIPSRHQESHRKGLERFMATGEGWAILNRRVETEAKHRDGHEFPIELTVTPISTNDQVVFNAFVRDISDRRRSQKALHDLSGRLIEAQENERRRIAYELHDDLNQRLALLAIELDQIALKPPKSARKLREKINGLSQNTRELSATVHQLSYELHPAKLEHLGLVDTVQSLCDEVSGQDGIKIKFSHEGIPKSLPREIALCLYRITQEAIQNMVRHSGAETGRVSLTGQEMTINLDLSDAGRGFDVDKVKTKGGLGVVGMEERVRHVGGTLSIESHVSSGTRLKVRVPLENASWSG